MDAHSAREKAPWCLLPQIPPRTQGHEVKWSKRYLHKAAPSYPADAGLCARNPQTCARREVLDGSDIHTAVPITKHTLGSSCVLCVDPNSPTHQQ